MNQVTLLKLARYVLNEHVRMNRSDFSDDDLTEFTFTEKHRTKAGAFVTLKKSEALRGCIGYVLPQSPLYRTVIENTIHAASQDPRFPPVVERELSSIRIEVSVMSPLSELESTDQIQIGRDGLLLKNRGRTGLLLPQVPVEWEWDVKTFLEHLSCKAGLPKDAYRDPTTQLFRFSAEVFGE